MVHFLVCLRVVRPSPLIPNVRRRTQMSNPYASPNISANLDPQDVDDTSLVRGIAFALCSAQQRTTNDQSRAKSNGESVARSLTVDVNLLM